MADRTRWTDERIDDLATIIKRDNERLDALQNLIAAHDLQLTEVERERRSRLDQRFSFRLALMSIVLGQLLTIATVFLTAHH